MDYEKKYKEALERADTLMEKEGKKLNVIPICKYIFPEFDTVSKDERIRKEIIDFVKSRGGFKGDWIAWLEKQGEKKLTDEVEPKFKVGDFITNDYCLGKVIEITNDAYLLDTGQGIPFSCEHNAHLWTIEDAKDGDVLVYVTDEEDLWIMIYWSLYEPYEWHVHYHALLVNDNFSDKGTCCICIDNLKPATKEQRDLLFQKMKEAGYEWDAEKKEVKKIEVASKESEDERIRKELIEQIAYIIPNNDEIDDEGNALPSYQERINKYRAWLENQGENKPTDEVEPKFKVGNWITDGYIYYKITEILDDRYIIESKYDKRGAILFEYENRYHLWTIEDAKDGDVLALISGQCIFLFDGYDKEYCHYSKLTNSFSPNLNYIGFIQHQFVPATKEQRNLLFAKMREAGYEWDSEKKELKKIEVTSKESEDEKTRKSNHSYS